MESFTIFSALRQGYHYSLYKIYDPNAEMCFVRNYMFLLQYCIFSWAHLEAHSIGPLPIISIQAFSGAGMQALT